MILLGRYWVVYTCVMVAAVVVISLGAGVGMGAGIGAGVGVGVVTETAGGAVAGAGNMNLKTTSVDPYMSTIDKAYARGMRVWLEVDLSRQWLRGTTAFNETVRRVAALAARPGVVGVKIADELGYYDGLNSQFRIERFLGSSASALRRAAPGKLILVDLLVPQMGCLPQVPNPSVDTRYCMTSKAQKFPHLTLDMVDGYLKSGNVDVVNLATYLRSDAVYKKWGFTADDAQRAAWNEVNRRGWQNLVQVWGRKAIAHAGKYRGTSDAANASLVTSVDIPILHGARGVDLWAWRQRRTGEIYRLANPGNTTNALWKTLRTRRASGVRLSTHFSPASVERGIDADLDIIATVFTDLLVAAGTG